LLKKILSLSQDVEMKMSFLSHHPMAIVAMKLGGVLGARLIWWRKGSVWMTPNVSCSLKDSSYQEIMKPQPAINTIVG